MKLLSEQPHFCFGHNFYFAGFSFGIAGFSFGHNFWTAGFSFGLSFGHNFWTAGFSVGLSVGHNCLSLECMESIRFLKCPKTFPRNLHRISMEILWKFYSKAMENL